MTIEPKHQEQTLEAIAAFNRRLTVADLSERAGISLTEARRALDQTCLATLGNIEVPDQGDVVYKFPNDFIERYAETDSRILLNAFGRAFFQLLFFILRVFFAAGLIAILVMSIPWAGLTHFSVSSKDPDVAFGYFLLKMFFLGGLILIFHYERKYIQPDYPPDRHKFLRLADSLGLGNLVSAFSWDYDEIKKLRRVHTPSTGNTGQVRSGFIGACLSFVFGDGESDNITEEQRWSILAELIRRNGGVLIEEQLAPYTVSNSLKQDMLSCLLKFDGAPIVMPTGNIVYAFPSLGITGGSGPVDELPKFLEQPLRQFSRTSIIDLLAVWLFAAFSLCLSYLYRHYPNDPTFQAYGYIFSLYQPLLTFLYPFSIFMLTVAGIRFIITESINQVVRRANEERTRAAENLLKPSAQLQAKLDEAKLVASQMRVITQDQIIYTTEKDSLGQQIENLSRHIDKSKHSEPIAPNIDGIEYAG